MGLIVRSRFFFFFFFPDLKTAIVIYPFSLRRFEFNMLISSYRFTSICHLVGLLASLWASPGNGAAIQPPASTLEEPGNDNHTDIRLAKRALSELRSILETSYQAKTMLDPEQANNGILSIEQVFGSEPWTITYYNGPKNYVDLIITAKGALIVRIPVQNAKDSSKPRKSSSSTSKTSAPIDNQKYDRLIKKPLVSGILGQTVRDWMKSGQTDPKNWWFPDIVRILAVGPYDPTPGQILYPAAYHQSRKDVVDLWRKGPTGKVFPNIIGDNPSEDGGPSEEPQFEENPDSGEGPRLEEVKMPSKPSKIPAWGAEAKSESGFAITWTPGADASSGRYEIWVGAKDTRRPWREETLEGIRWTDPAVSSWNWGYYPQGVVPVGYPNPLAGPGAGCHYYDPCAF